jgi:hypothetical protein
MPSANIRLNTGNQITTDYEISKIFLFNNRYEDDTDAYVNNSGYSTLTLLAGTVMGRVSASGQLKPCYVGSIDGSQEPVGVLAHDIVNLSAGASVNVIICIGGDVAQRKLIFLFGDTLETIVNGRRYKDRIQTNTTIILRGGEEMTDYDN